VDYSRKESWTVGLLEKTLDQYGALAPEARGDFGKLWRAKLDYEARTGIRIRPWREIMTKEELDEEGLAYARATLEIEGLMLAPEQEALVRRRLRGEIAHETFLRLAKELAVSSSGQSDGFIRSEELDEVLGQAARAAKEEAFAAGLPVSCVRNGRLLREYPDGAVEEVVQDA